MKKNFLIICLLCFVCSKVSAQFEQNSEDYKPQISISMSYCPVNEAYDGISMDVTIKHLHLQYQGLDGEKNKYITKNKVWRAGIGYNQRYWFAKRLYVEGVIGIQYSHQSVKAADGEKESDGSLGLWTSPKVGILLFNLSKSDPMWIGLQAGYRWDVNEFKLKKDYTNNYFTVGFVIAG